jgi:cytosine/adenosine deaminase-related metal-dependent hydrolase
MSVPLQGSAIGPSEADRALDLLRRSAGDPRRRILITNGTVITMDRELGDFARADVLVEGARIVAIAPDLGAAASAGQAIVVPADDMIVMPGFHDTHRHCWQNQLRRLLSGYDLPEYIAIALKSIAPHYRPADMQTGNLLAGLGAIDSGVTTVLDFSHNARSSGHADGALAGLRESGVRAVFTCAPPLFGSWDEQWPEDLRRLREQDFASDDQLVTLRSGLLGAPDLGGERYALTPQSIGLARELGIAMSVDAAFGPSASANIVALGEAGLLGPDITLIHCNDLSETAWRLIAEHEVGVSLCPTSDTQIGIFDALPPVQSALDHGVRPGLSVDVECALSTDMFTQMQAIYTIQRMRAYGSAYAGEEGAPTPIGVRSVLEMATVNGAGANRLLARSGSLTPGKDADIVLLGAEDINTMPLNNAVATIVLGADSRNVHTVFVAGQVRKWDGALLEHDLGRLKRLVRESRDFLMTASEYPLDVLSGPPPIATQPL